MSARLLLGDCLVRMKLLEDASVDMILCDLPYGTTACKWDTVIPFDVLWEQYARVIKENGAIVLFAGQPFTSLLVQSNIKHFKYTWVWEKTSPTGFLNSKKEPLRLTEDICVFYRKPPTYNPQFVAGKPYKSKWSSGTEVTNKTEDWRNTGYYESDGARYPVNIFTVKKDSSQVHPTQKPVVLLEYLIKTYTNPGEVVLDNTMGSGSTGVACVNTGREFIGIEKDPGYFTIATKRITDAEAALVSQTA